MSEPPPSRAQHLHFRPVAQSQPSAIGLRRLRSNIPSTPSATAVPESSTQQDEGDREGRRRRSHSAPQPLVAGPRAEQEPARARMPSVVENVQSQEPDTPTAVPVVTNEYHPRIVDILDVIDPEVSTLSSITNIQNSLFVPSLGRFVNRRPTYDLDQSYDRIPPDANASAEATESDVEEETTADIDDTSLRPARSRRAPSLGSVLDGTHYAVLPHGVSLDGWGRDEVAELNDHVRHMLHSRRSQFKRSARAFGKYVRKPLGFLVTLYATLITLFGLAWVLFLIGWIYVGSRQLYVINVIDNVLVALFAVVGDGLAPFRAVDTYHMIFIAHYHRLTWKLREQKALPGLQNRNDLPDLEGGNKQEGKEGGREELSVLTPKQQARLEHHQSRFARSHTFYKPHETETHLAFPLGYLVAVVVLLDLHSCLQISLGACTWGIDYRTRPAALTATILSCSITVNILAGVAISVGGRRTRKKDVVERMFRQELTEEALREMRERSSRLEGDGKRDRLRKIDEALDEAGEGRGKREESKREESKREESKREESKREKTDDGEEKEGGKSFFPRHSLDAWRGRGKKPAREAGRFDVSKLGRENISPSEGAEYSRRASG